MQSNPSNNAQFAISEADYVCIIQAAIMSANLGSGRSESQDGACVAFSAALYDVLRSVGIKCGVWTAEIKIDGILTTRRYHSVVKVGTTYFDSLGIFTDERVRKQAKIHRDVEMSISFSRDCRDLDDEDIDFHEFLVKKLKKSMGIEIKKNTDRLITDGAALEPQFSP